MIRHVYVCDVAETVGRWLLTWANDGSSVQERIGESYSEQDEKFSFSFSTPSYRSPTFLIIQPRVKSREC